MRLFGIVSFAAMALAGPRTEAATHTSAAIKVSEIVSKLAFDPAKFTNSGEYVSITYRGDDRGWPVYSIVIQSACPTSATQTPGCAARLTARMVRAPAPPDIVRPRQRGILLISNLLDRRATTKGKIAKVLTSEGVEWLEADIAKCPSADAVLDRANEANWIQGVDRRRGEPDADGMVEEIIVLHADTVEVTFGAWLQNSTYTGYIADGSPAEWAVELADALEPCWRPATTTAPWLR